MQNGRDHDEREQKYGSRIERELTRGSGDDEIPELDRRAKSTDPAPTQKGVEEERERHNRQGTWGGNVDEHHRG